MKAALHILVLFGLITQLFAQESPESVLSFEQYMQVVADGHPVIVQASLKSAEGARNLQRARGAFDPKIEANYNEKFYDQQDYYGLLDAGLKVPTWYGIELEGGFAQNQGDFLNPENKLPDDGLWYAGITVPVGQGLMLDQRRTSLEQAKIYRELTEVERKLMVNQVLYDAGLAYWKWFKAYNKVLIYQDAMTLAETRLRAVKESAKLGDRPAIDTLEAGIQLQNRQLGWQQARLEFQNSTIMLSVYLWAEGIIPLEPGAGTKPVGLTELAVEERYDRSLAFQDSLLSNHPELQKMELGIEQLHVERRWKSEQLKPDLALKYNFLTRPVNEDRPYSFSGQDYTWGLQLSFPILLRKERADLELTKLKIQERTLGVSGKRGQLLYKVNAAINIWNNTADQIELYRKTVDDYRQLLDGERKKFEIGESALFLVNTREINYIAAQVKLIEIIGQYRKARLSFQYTLGQLGS